MNRRGDRRHRGRSQSTQTTNAENNRNTSDKKSPPADPPISAPIAPQTAIGPNEDQGPAKTQESNSSEPPNDGLLVRYTRSLRNWTVGLVLVGLLTVGVLSLQWFTFEKTDETNRVGLRPYISGVGLSADIERYPLYWDMSAILENSGGTPPLELRYVIRSSPEFPLDPEEVFQHPSETDAFFERSVAPKGQIRVEAGMPLITFFDNRKAWYISGAIHYRDQFHGNSEHVSKFCFAVVSVKDVKTNLVRPSYDPCHYWNCIDEKACTNDRARYDKAVRNGEIRPVKKSTDTPDIPIGTALPSANGMIIKALP
jgi:hypothetical protein